MHLSLEYLLSIVYILVQNTLFLYFIRIKESQMKTDLAEADLERENGRNQRDCSSILIHIISFALITGTFSFNRLNFSSNKVLLRFTRVKGSQMKNFRAAVVNAIVTLLRYRYYFRCNCQWSIFLQSSSLQYQMLCSDT